MKFTTMALAGGTLAVALVLAGCSGTAPSGHAGMGTDMHGSPTASDPADGEHNAADVSFAQGMVMHHRQAVEMSDLVLGKSGVDAKVTELARRITAAQQPEIDTMNGWLDAWHADMGASHDMGGMMSESDMNALRHASGADAGTVFLTQMIEHHQGAVTMANEEIKSGKNTEAVHLAKTIVADQTAEITEMKGILASL
ncbi:DUF305 domain-containing protein [Leifsonia sp. NPDC080035]|uniref:DUF305 domain-containing protein n=1 Tax=Leifsonia sp. NPDC080035 TaxID=3143936 RepID=A0AAU7GJD8_9MICO